MKMNFRNLSHAGWPAAIALLLVTAPAKGAPRADSATSAALSKPDENGAEATATSKVTIETSDTTPTPGLTRKEMPWLGLSTVEASEALASQLDLSPGVGLVVTYVVPDSPASKSGLRKNDVLTQFDDQSLVHPAQFRKLVRVRKEGDVINLVYYRAGKKQNVSVTLGKTKAEARLWNDGDEEWRESFKDLGRQFRDLHLDDTVRNQVKILKDSLGNIKIDQNEVKEDVRRGMEEARKAIQEALRNVTNADPVRKVLENLAHSGVVLDDKADVVVRSSGRHVKSLVRSDDSGTIVVVGNPKLHLTAHDKEGKLLFDGPIESAEDKGKVPPELWDRVEPVVNQMRTDAEEPDTKDSQ
jgi:hypothetical protein